MEPFETFEHDGVTVELHYDEDGGYADPRQHDNLTTMVCWHPDYALGDEQIVNGDGRGAVESRNGECQRDAKARLSPLSPRSMEHLQRYITLMRKGVAVRSMYLLDHSGLSLSFGSPSAADSGGWDTTMIGFAYTTHERITELCGDEPEYHSDEWIEKAVAGECEEYASYIAGEVYGYIVAPDADDEEACWGMIGDEHVRESAKEVAAGIAEDRRKARANPWLPTFGNPIVVAGAR